MTTAPGTDDRGMIRIRCPKCNSNNARGWLNRTGCGIILVVLLRSHYS